MLKFRTLYRYNVEFSHLLTSRKSGALRRCFFVGKFLPRGQFCILGGAMMLFGFKIVLTAAMLFNLVAMVYNDYEINKVAKRGNKIRMVLDVLILITGLAATIYLWNI